MNYIHAVKKNGDYHPPINLDNIVRISTSSSGGYHKLYFRLVDGNDTTWEFDNDEELKLHLERVLDVIKSKNLSDMVTL